MKAIVCEMCSSHDVIKDGDYYVCRNCGTKYTVENAKKLMVEVEGKVDVTGSTVKVDNTDSLANFRQLAARARETGNSANAAKYYEMIAIQDPNDWEAAFYSVYYTAAGCKIGQIASAANSVSNAIPGAMQLIKQNLPESLQKTAYIDVANSVISLRKALRSSAQEHYNKFSNVDGAGSELAERKRACDDMLYLTAKAIHRVFGDKDNAMEMYKTLLQSDDTRFASELKQAATEIDPEWVRQYDLKNAKSGRKSGIAALIIGALLAVGFWFLAKKAGWFGLSTTVNIILYVVIGLFGLFALFGLIGIFTNSAAAKKLKEQGPDKK